MREEEVAEVNTWTTGKKILSDDTNNARSTEKKKSAERTLSEKTQEMEQRKKDRHSKVT